MGRVQERLPIEPLVEHPIVRRLMVQTVTRTINVPTSSETFAQETVEETLTMLAEQAGLNYRTLHRYLRAGVPACKADAIATALGLWSGEIWPEVFG